MGPLVWLGAAVVLALLELLAGDLAFLMLAGGALAASGAAALDAPPWLTVAVFGVVSVALVFGVRPPLKKRITATSTHTDLSPRALVGRTGVTVEEITSDRGLVTIDGELWSARSQFEGDVFAVDERAIVSRIEGSMAYVMKESR